MAESSIQYYKKDFWIKENLKYVEPHFRLCKASRIINKLAQGRECDLLDVGCGPATLADLLDKDIHYHGIDIAIQQPAPNLVQADSAEAPIAFRDKKFDIIVAQGFFEYIGSLQAQKFREIAGLLKHGGRFVVSYVNFDHHSRNVYWPYNNVQPFDAFRNSLEQCFTIERFFPTSHRRHHDEPRKRLMKAIQMRINLNIPVLSRMFAVEYFFICSAKA